MKQLRAEELTLALPGGRKLVDKLDFAMESEHVALIGRNGVGKSTLFSALAGEITPRQGRVICSGTLLLVPQRIEQSSSRSPGEARRRSLEAAFSSDPDFLLLDEPSQDLDRDGTDWLLERLKSLKKGLLVITHDRRILRQFEHFFMVRESGCRLFSGSFEALCEEMRQEEKNSSQRYAAELSRLIRVEERSATIRLRRERKRAGGRTRELDRCPARINLNNKRGYAQVYQGKREAVRLERLATAREFARSARRALEVRLPLDVSVPHGWEAPSAPLVTMRDVSANGAHGVLFSSLSCDWGPQKVALEGPNGCGKSTLLNIALGLRRPESGRVFADLPRIGYVSQQAENFRSRRSLVDVLLQESVFEDMDEVARTLAAHRFPWALAMRPLASLSPGERTRAALIALFRRSPSPQLLVLDEPTNQLDLAGLDALERVLGAFPGGLVVVSHDEEFLERIGVESVLRLGG